MIDVWTEHCGERHRIVVIEYHRRRPCGVVTECHWDHSKMPWFRPGRDRAAGTTAYAWDFDWSRRMGGLYYHSTGMGGDPLVLHLHRFVHPVPPPGILWYAEDVQLVTWKSDANPAAKITEAQALKRGYRRLRRPLLLTDDYGRKTRNPFEAGSETECRMVYCAICRDWMPDDYGTLCRHLEHCDECGEAMYVDRHTHWDDRDGEPWEHEPEEAEVGT